MAEEGWPDVSVIVPARDAAATLDDALASICGQDYPGLLEVVVAVAPGEDGTADVVRAWAERDSRVRAVENTQASTPAGLNRAIAASSGQVVARVDAHSVIPPGYLRTAVEALRDTGAVNVGGVQDAVGTTPFERAVAAVMGSWIGSGGAAYRHGDRAGPVDTVYLGVFSRKALEQVGGFDETLARNQDYELNVRLREAGGTVWLEPALRVRYRPRGDLAGLARQYFAYGQWKRRVLRRHPGAMQPRQLAPPIVVAAGGLGVALAPWTRGRSLVLPLGYLAVATAAALAAGRDLPRPERRLTPLVAVTMHVAWAAGFLRG